MRDGDQLRFRGPAGAEFVVTVGPAFDARTIQARIDAGEWTPVEQTKPQPEKPSAPKKRAPRRATKQSD